MAGWNYVEGMSNNAARAYAHNIKPLSRFALEDLRQVGWSESKIFAIWLAKKSDVWISWEYHHCSKFGNQIDFYDPENLVQEWGELTEKEKEELRNAYKEERREG